MSTSTIKARPTLYKGTRMRSRLEADYASSLDRAGRDWEYEPVCFGGPDGQWLPDFRLGAGRYVELKPASLLTCGVGEETGLYSRIDQILRKMTVAWHSEPAASLWLIFWNYGAESAPMTITGDPDMPWLTWSAPVAAPLLWPGMGQLYRLADVGLDGRRVASYLHELEAEQGILGAMMRSRSVVEDILEAEVVRPWDHYRPAHQLIHEAILDLYAQGEPTGAAAVAEGLLSRGDLARCGGGNYLDGLIKKGASPMSPEAIMSMAVTVRDLAAERKRLAAAAAS